MAAPPPGAPMQQPPPGMGPPGAPGAPPPLPPPLGADLAIGGAPSAGGDLGVLGSGGSSGAEGSSGGGGGFWSWFSGGEDKVWGGGRISLYTTVCCVACAQIPKCITSNRPRQTPLPFAVQAKVASPSSSEPHTFSEDKFAPPPMPEGFKSGH